MAIGSEAEIGATFSLMQGRTLEQLDEWYAYIRENWHPYLMNGYAKLIHHKDNPYYQGERSDNGTSVNRFRLAD